MKALETYVPPTTEQLEALKESLGLSSRQMAQLAGVSGSSQWRKYTGGEKPRDMGLHMLFYMAAQLELDDKAFFAIVERMRAIGAKVEFEGSD